MTRFFVFIMALLPIAAFAGALDETFSDAQQAYDAGRYAEAAEQYEALLEQDIVNPEVHYNLANARFKAGDLPAAVLNYRRAWYTRPRDPDIQANLSFALSAAGATAPEPSLVSGLLQSLSKAEWIIVATTIYLLLCGLLTAALRWPRGRRILLKSAGLLFIAFLCCAAGWWSWQRVLKKQPELVVVKSGAKTLYGPVENSKAHYKIPLGALVQQRTTDPRGWVEVVYDGKSGWIRQSYIKPVSP